MRGLSAKGQKKHVSIGPEACCRGAGLLRQTPPLCAQQVSQKRRRVVVSTDAEFSSVRAEGGKNFSDCPLEVLVYTSFTQRAGGSRRVLPPNWSKSQPALLRLSAIISQYFTRAKFCLFCSLHSKFAYLALDTVVKGDTCYCPLAAAGSPSLIASASLTYLPFLVVP
jgi:hypothetical protein